MKNLLLLVVLLNASACAEKNSTPPQNNHAPLVSLTSAITSVDPFTFTFTAAASDADGDNLTYNWDFGDGTTRQGGKEESHNYAVNKTYTVKVSVSDANASPVIASTTINTTITGITIDMSKKAQTMEGFGGFGAQDVYWSNGPFTSARFVDDLINDLGLTILRDNIPTNFEIVNDNDDPFNTDLSRYNIDNNTEGHDGKLSDHLQYLKDMKAAGLNQLIVSIWSAPPWMKTNNNISNGTSENSAPSYNPDPTSADNQLRTGMYDEFAEMCVAYIKIIKQETGIDVYAISLQNEPRFSQFYASCVYNGEALRDLIKVVGKRFEDEGITAKIFMPEDIGYLDGVSGMVQPTLNDPGARKYVSIIAVHGYALDGVTADSPDAQTWQTMYSWGKPYNMPLWMTETSGYSNDMTGAMDLARAMYTAINFGNVSAWLYWELSQQNLDPYSLMSSSGEKSKRYYISRNFYHYIKPGDHKAGASANEATKIYPLAFKNDIAKTTTIILINDNATDQPVKLSGAGLPSQFSMYITNANDDCKDHGIIKATDGFVLPANSVTTLYKKN